MNRTFIIAEAGVNHNGSIDTAKKLVDIAVSAGADAVKFQTFCADKLVTATAAKAKYQIEKTMAKESQYEMLRKLELSPNAHKELFRYCEAKGIIFMSTPFDEDSADMLNDLGMNIFKIPSGEITNKPLIKHIAAKGKPIILSTGMSNLGEVEKAILWISQEWDKLGDKPQLTLLHCLSSYPAPIEHVNLLAMKTMKKAFDLPVGYSDHTMGIEIPIAAVAVGAKVIEKHITLDRSMEGPDHKASLEPEELKLMVKSIRNIEKALGDGKKRPTKSEEEMKQVIRKSIVTTRDIKAGEAIALIDIAIKRPGNGIPPEFQELIVNMRVRRDISADSPIRWEDIQLA
jgi:N-acetylneuraminate synthase